VTVIELLAQFGSITLSLAELLAAIPPLKPRYYSISSSPRATSGHVSITVGVVRGTSPTGRLHKGVCSNFLAGRAVGDRVLVSVKDAGALFRLPPQLPDAPPVPVIMVGPGTGLAPMMGFLQEIDALRTAGHWQAEALLFFGCRTEAEVLYKSKLEGFLASGTLTALHVAMSRIAGHDKRYVQNDILDNAAHVWRLLASGAHIYVCGDASRMAPDVKKTFKKVCVVAGGLEESAASDFIDGLVSLSGGRYHEDVWAGNA